ncbi:MAG: hypothetical protein E6929_13465 [Clostridium sp.]|nr:hypothetical protein [Clostridium sp.]
MRFWEFIKFWELLGNGVFLIIFCMLTIISLSVFRLIFNRRISDNVIEKEGIVTIVNSIVLVLSMLGVAISGWYTLLHYCI